MAQLPRSNYPNEIAVYNRLKKFVRDFKKKNKRLPSKKEIQTGGKFDYQTVVKYLDEGKDYLTYEEMIKTKQPPIAAKDLTAPQKKWYAKNKDYLFIDKNGNFKKGPDDFMSLNTNQRYSVKNQYANRANTGLNHPRVKMVRNEKELEKILQKEIDKVKPGDNVVINSTRKDYLKKIKAPADLQQQSVKKVFDNFDGRFVFSGTKYEDIPGLEKEIIKLAKTKGPREIVLSLIKDNKIPPQNITPGEYGKKVDLKSVRQILNKLVKEKKIKEILPADQTQGPKDQLVKKYINQNPKISNAFQIAKGVNSTNPDTNISANFVRNAIARLGLTKEITTRHGKIFPEIKALDKIVKNNRKLILDPTIDAGTKLDKLINDFAAATKKTKAVAADEIVSRLRNLGALYTNSSDDRYETKLYKTIKPPINYLGEFQKNLIAVTDRAGQMSNAHMARMLGLPQKEIKLLENTASAMQAFDFKVAGDHTDIKSLMKNFPNYKKNFMRIQYIKDDLNDYKRRFDVRVKGLANEFRLSGPERKSEIIESVKQIQNEFKKNTGYDLGGFEQTETGRIFIDPQTPRLSDLKNPITQTLQTAMKNFETTSAPDGTVETFTNPLDRAFKTATSVADRVNLFNKYKGTNVAKTSKVLKGLQKIPGIGKIATGVIGGVATMAAMTSLAQAGETNQPEVKKPEVGTPIKYDSNIGAIVNERTDQPASQNQILSFIKDNPLAVTAGTSYGFAAQEVPRAYKAARELGRGKVRSALGITGALKPLLTTIGTPAMTGLFETANISNRLDAGETPTEILTDPLGPTLGLAFMEPFSRGAGVIRDAPKRTMAQGLRNYFNLSDVGKARPGITSQILRLGMSPRMIAGASRFLGIPGLLLGTGLSAYDAYKNYQNQEGMIYNLFNKDE